MSGRVWIFVYASDPDPGATAVTSGRPGEAGPPSETGHSAVSSAYTAISKSLAGVPGLLRNQLLRSVPEPWRFVVTSEWESLAAFRRWESGADHRGTTAPLRRMQDFDAPRTFGPYEVVAEHS
jgi:heme-degrading monooxygenase HmoA